MEMKRKITREVKIGLSILLLLTLILAGVVVRRVAQAGAHSEEEIARAEERHDEPRRDEHENHQPDLFPKPGVVTPLEAPHHDALHALDDPKHWNTDATERKKEAQAAAALLANPPSTLHPSQNGKPHHKDGERVTTYAPELPPPASGYPDDDYRYANMTAPPAVEQHKRDGAKSTVIQVSDSESPRPLDHYATGENPVRSDKPERFGQGDRQREGIPPVPFANGAGSSPDSRYTDSSAGDAGRPYRGGTQHFRDDRDEKARNEPNRAEKPQDRTYRDVPTAAGVSAPRGNYMAGPSEREIHNGYDPALPQPAGNMQPNYSRDANYTSPPSYAAAQSYGTPGGYAPERLPHEGLSREGRDELGRKPPQIPLREDGMYEVQPNDSYWTISERVYGSGAYFRALAEQNRGRAARPDRLQPGLLISTPPIAKLEKDYPDFCPRPSRRDTVRERAASIGMVSTAGGGRTYIVQEGDTLSSIARSELGKVSRWPDIYQLNRQALGKDWDYLTPGMRLVLPIRDTQPGDRTTRRDDGGPLNR
jgi:nucleoid-associated protein YgaU